MVNASNTYISEFPGVPTITGQQKQALFFSVLIVLVVIDLFLILSIFNPWSKPSANLKVQSNVEESYSASISGDKPSAFGPVAIKPARTRASH